jgi:peptidoglycan hydrolase-like protein with peptidoglycan-binding domain
MPSPCYSSRGGAHVRLIVIHTAEGALTIESLGSWFANPNNQVSSHTGADDKPNTVGQYVQRGNKAWTAANANPVAVQIELCGFAAWTTDEWNEHPNMLDNCAKWIAEEAAAFDIPIVKLSPGAAQGSGRGVCQHVDLGGWGGNHTDCGSQFPIDQVIAMAKGDAQATPTPPASGKAPPFPYPSSDYLGQPSPDPHCHSGYYGGADAMNVETWQTQMRHGRHWNLAVDGQYGPESERVCRQFQANKGLSVDGLCGPTTWAASWNLPVGG